MNPNNKSLRNIRYENLCNKRKFDKINDNLNNKIDDNDNNKKNKTDDKWNYMISAGSVRNYMLDDPLDDFLDYYDIKSLLDKPIKKDNYVKKNKEYKASTKYYMDNGKEFEDFLINKIKENHKVITVSTTGLDSRSVELFNETIKLMKEGVPIIYQGVLHNYDNNTYGIPDLIVRADYINKLLNYNAISEKESHIGSPNLNLKYHYKIIDIKGSTISLKSDGIHIRKTCSIPAFKGQLYIYQKALNNIQGININKAYIWGKKYDHNTNIYNYMNKLGTIDYDINNNPNDDFKYIKKTNDAIKWVQELRMNGYKWCLLPKPSRAELYPNMKNSASEYIKLKQQLADKLYEITNIWNCGIDMREKAHSKNILGWNDPKCTTKNLGLKKNNQNKIIDSILNINRQNKILISPSKIIYDRNNWIKTPKDTMNFYFDFESFSESNLDINNMYVYLIGVGYVKDNTWIYKDFLMKNKNNQSEYDMTFEFIKYIKNILILEKKKKATCFHWCSHEKTCYENIKLKNSNIIFDDSFLNFYDLNKIFVNEPVVIKGAKNFKLKEIAKTLYNQRKINSSWDSNSSCIDGLDASILAINIYNNLNNIILTDLPEIKDIINYNEIDCKVLFEIHQLIKNEH